MADFSLKLLFACLILATPLSGFADIYTFRDAKGQLHFVDDPSKVPGPYRQNLQTIESTGEALGRFESTVPVTAPAAPSSSKPPGPDRPPLQQPARQQTPVVIKGNRVLVPVEAALGNRVVQLLLLLDTGATTTVFHRQALAELDLPRGRPYKAMVAGGSTVRSSKIRFRYIKVGPFRTENASAMVINLKEGKPPFDGMLGMDFLKNHPYQVDFNKQVLHWDPVE